MSLILKKFHRRGDRCLLFSLSTRTLDIIEKWAQSMGYSYLKLDGTTPTAKRQGLVDKYQRDPTIFLFLISTKAGGMGLNLTGEYNTSHHQPTQSLTQPNNPNPSRLATYY